MASKNVKETTKMDIDEKCPLPTPMKPTPCCRLPKESQLPTNPSQPSLEKKPEIKKMEEKKPEVKKPEEKKPEEKKPEVKKPEEKKPEEKKPEVKKPEEKKPEVKKPEEKKPEMKKPEEKKPEEKKMELTEKKLDVSTVEKKTVEASSTPIAPPKIVRNPIIEKSANLLNPWNVAVPRWGSFRAVPLNLDEKPLVISIHLVPSLPVGLFEILAEVIEAGTGKAVSLVYESRCNRPVAKDVTDIAFLPASDNWGDGSLLPVSFVFEHRLNKAEKPAIYVDVVISPDCMKNVEEIIDLRGYRCALPDRRKALGAAGLLFSHLKSKGENPTFFGNTLDSGSQVAALQMVAGKQAEVGVLEAPVINYHKNTLPGVDTLCVLASLGPLPPYRIMLNKNLQASLGDKIKESLLGLKHDVEWIERLKPYGVSGFAEYSEDLYNLDHIKKIATSVPYY